MLIRMRTWMHTPLRSYVHVYYLMALSTLQLSGYRGRLRGILVELPTLIETYKSVDSDILFKSGEAANITGCQLCTQRSVFILCTPTNTFLLIGTVAYVNTLKLIHVRFLDVYIRVEPPNEGRGRS